MNSTQGWINEDKFVDHINGKSFKELNNNVKFLLSYIFPFVRDNDKLYCSKTEDFIKPDIAIQWKEKISFVSLKTGITNTVHGEFIDSFCDFLRSKGVPDIHIETLRRFCFGDGTTDGTGAIRKQSFEVRVELNDQIKDFNAFFDDRKELIKETVLRCMFDGVNPQAYKADYLYYGNLDYGNFVSKKQVMHYLDCKNWRFMDCLHIGPLVIRPHARYAGKETLNELNRHRVTITWPNLMPDIQYIQKRFNY